MIESPTLALIKLSVLFLYQRIFNVPMFRKIVKVMISIVGLWTVSSLLLNLLKCGHQIESNFSQTVEDANQHCADMPYLMLAYIISDICVDLLILAQPIPTVGLSRKYSRLKCKNILTLSGVEAKGVEGKTRGDNRDFLDGSLVSCFCT